MAGGRRTILVTGFGAFPGVPANPTVAILRILERHGARLARLGIALHGRLLPVGYEAAVVAMREAVQAVRPDVIVHLGVAARRKTISVETRAVNRAGPLRPDAHRRTPRQILEPGAGHHLAARFPAARVAAAMRAAGHPARLSIDAGDYVCNATLYRSVLWQLAPEVGFLHVPATRPRHRPARRAPHAPPTVEALSRAVVAALLVLARAPLERSGTSHDEPAATRDRFATF